MGSVNIILTSFLSSSEKAGLGFFISIMRSVIVMIPAVLILSSLYGMTGVWISFVLTELIVLVIGVNSIINLSKVITINILDFAKMLKLSVEKVKELKKRFIQ
ncbi:hypothetical protein [Clostridium sediminicola]|uniref:hypothetical protein n=1 Tax=Clostridium sediminicola TaxID=3114879 RepID=UPI003D16C339